LRRERGGAKDTASVRVVGAEDDVKGRRQGLELDAVRPRVHHGRQVEQPAEGLAVGQAHLVELAAAQTACHLQVRVREVLRLETRPYLGVVPDAPLCLRHDRVQVRHCHIHITPTTHLSAAER
jgi:hypothetical protein